jgi:hypothetical protein
VTHVYGQLGLHDIQASLSELDALSLEEYGLPLEAVLLDPSPISAMRVQRLTGILLKRPFAIESVAPASSETKARRSWPWAKESPDAQAAIAPTEFAILNELRQVGPWQERTPPPGAREITWEQLQNDVETERGLFKVLALYLNDKLRRQQGKSFKEYLEAEESRHFEAGLDLADLVFNAAVMEPIAAAIGVPTVAVGAALVAIQYGYRVFTDPNEGRRGDGRN